jgi:hypothetical protein
MIKLIVNNIILTLLFQITNKIKNKSKKDIYQIFNKKAQNINYKKTSLIIVLHYKHKKNYHIDIINKSI